MSFTVAFAGARDNYQVPLAIYQADLLSVLVTDFYAHPLIPSSLSKKVRSRQHPDLPASKVRSPLRAIERNFVRPAILKALGARNYGRTIAGDVQSIISLAALRAAESANSNLFLYAGYAYEAFTDPRSNSMKKILFMYHPHIQMASEILFRDSERHPNLAESTESIQEDLKDRTNDVELQLADLVLCASTFTARSVEHIGIPRSKIRVIPYGIEPQNLTESLVTKSKGLPHCEFLFVGSAVQRKGLHLLLQAWKEANLKGARLTVVARSIVKEIADLLQTPNVNFIPGATQSRLDELYGSSDVFVMPSLVEGFGYVYLEALSKGCFCIGTSNTGLPDLKLPESAAEVIEAGSVEALSAALSKAASLSQSGCLDRAEITRCVTPHTWTRFRFEVARLGALLLN